MGCVGVHRRQVRAAGGVLRVKPDCVYWIDEWSRNECMVFDMATGTSTLHPGPTWCRVQDPEQSTATSQMTISGEDCTIKHIWLRSPPTSSLNSAQRLMAAGITSAASCHITLPHYVTVKLSTAHCSLLHHLRPTTPSRRATPPGLPPLLFATPCARVHTWADHSWAGWAIGTGSHATCLT
jgi:hypothetical protein